MHYSSVYRRLQCETEEMDHAGPYLERINISETPHVWTLRFFDGLTNELSCFC